MSWLSNWMDEASFSVPVSAAEARTRLKQAYIPFRIRTGPGFLGNRLLRAEWREHYLRVRGPQNLRFDVYVAYAGAGATVRIQTHAGRVFQLLTLLAVSLLVSGFVASRSNSVLLGIVVGLALAAFFLVLLGLMSLSVKRQQQRFLDDLRNVLSE